VEKIGQQGGVNGHARGYGTDRSGLQVEEPRGGKPDEDHLIPESFRGIKGFSSFLQGQGRLNDIEGREAAKILSRAVIKEKEILPGVQGEGKVLEMEGILLQHCCFAAPEMIENGQAQGRDPAFLVGEDYGDAPVDSVGIGNHGYVSQRPSILGQDLDGGQGGKVRCGILTRVVLQGERTSVQKALFIRQMGAFLPAEKEGQKGVPVGLESLGQQLVVFHPVGRRFGKKNVQGYGFGSRRGAELKNRRIHLPRPGPVDSLLPGGLQAVLVHDDQNHLFWSGRTIGLQPAELIISLELIGFEDIPGIEKKNQDPGQETDEGARDDFPVSGGYKLIEQIQFLTLVEAI
jgi:hypothetical protein